MVATQANGVPKASAVQTTVNARILAVHCVLLEGLLVSWDMVNVSWTTIRNGKNSQELFVQAPSPFTQPELHQLLNLLLNPPQKCLEMLQPLNNPQDRTFPRHKKLTNRTPGLYYGVHTDWAVQNPPVYAFLFKVNPVVYTSFLNLADTFQAGPMASHVDQILAAYSLVPPAMRKRGFIYNLAAMPWGGMKGITDQGLAQLVASCRDAENKGVHVVLRFAHEMVRSFHTLGG